MFKLGLTGSIGMGKSTTAALFAEEGCAVWDADAVVHRLYSVGGAAVSPIAAVFPDAIDQGAVSRDRLRDLIGRDPGALKTIEGIVHPLVARDRQQFLATTDSDICILDIPLLFETGGNKAMNAVACVTVAPDVQKLRVMERGTMTVAQFEQILEKQMPNAEKCAMSDYVIETDTLDNARAQVRAIVQSIRGQLDA